MRAFAEKQNGARHSAESSLTRGTVVPSVVHRGLRSSGQPLEPATRGWMESRFGHDFSQVRIHADPSANAAASAVAARAFTMNRDIVFGAGEYRPHTEPGRRLLAHELAHVAQRAGGVSTPVAGAPLRSSDVNDRAEVEARRAADQVVRGGLAAVQRSQAQEAVILREPATSTPQRLKGDKARLKKLFDAVKATSVGKQFLGSAKGEPSLVWGDTGSRHAHFDGEDTITLNEKEADQLTDCQWQQVIAMELGNFANAALFDPVFTDCEKGKLGKDDFVRAIEKIEFDSRSLVIAAYQGGEFGKDCPAVFSGGQMSFEDFMKDSRGAEHRADYEQQWEETCRETYLKKHPTK